MDTRYYYLFLHISIGNCVRLEFVEVKKDAFFVYI